MVWSTLTPRERDVVAMVADGSTAKEIAIALDIAPRTVEKHIDHVRMKVRARNRTHMVAMALHSGTLQLADAVQQTWSSQVTAE